MQLLTSNFSKEFYLDQVHRPRHYGKGSAPLFGNFLEPISLTPWWVIPLVWLPPNFYLFYVGFVNQSPITALSLWVMGLFIWTLVEYCLHRFLFHLDYFCLTILMHLLSTFFCTGSTTICPWMATGWSYHQLCFWFWPTHSTS